MFDVIRMDIQRSAVGWLILHPGQEKPDLKLSYTAGGNRHETKEF